MSVVTGLFAAAVPLAAGGIPVTLSAFAAFVLAAATLIAAPGPDTLFVLSQAVEDRGVGLRSAAGVTIGICVHTAFVAVGVAAVYRAVPGALDAVTGRWRPLPLLPRRRRAQLCRCHRVVGWRRPATGIPRQRAQSAGRAVFLAFLPGFVSSGGSEPIAVAFLGGTYAVLTAGYLGGIALLADGVAGRLRSDDARRRLDRAAGAVLLALGVWVLFG